MENLPAEIAHYVSAGGVITIIGIMLREHKVFVRMKDRLNTLWHDRCKVKGDDYVPLENGRS